MRSCFSRNEIVIFNASKFFDLKEDIVAAYSAISDSITKRKMDISSSEYLSGALKQLKVSKFLEYFILHGFFFNLWKTEKPVVSSAACSLNRSTPFEV